jgi:Beta-catenin-interacting protein ICAT
VEILSALKGLGETLSTEESALIEKVDSVSLQQFIKISSTDTQDKLLALAENCLGQPE